MNTIIYTLIFVIGTLFGSFYTLAVYRIPKRQDITHTHSYCPNCNHKLGFLDLIPILSYIFLGAKCRYCKQKIRSRYLVLEILTGTLFLTSAILLDITFDNLSIIKIIDFSFWILYLTFIILIGVIDKETKQIDKLVIVYGIIISIIYMVYLYIVEKTNIYRYVIYILAYLAIFIFKNLKLKKQERYSYIKDILLVIIIMAVFTTEYVTANSIIITILAIAICEFIKKINSNEHVIKNDEINKIPIVFYLGISNIFWIMLVLFCKVYLL